MPMLLQVPRKLGLFASSMPEPYARFSMLPTAFTQAVCLLVKAAARDGTAQIKSAVLQQMTESGLVTCLDQLAEATAEQLELCSAAGAAAAKVDTPLSQIVAQVLLDIQVGRGGWLQYTQQVPAHAATDLSNPAVWISQQCVEPAPKTCCLEPCCLLGGGISDQPHHPLVACRLSCRRVWTL